MTVSLARRLLPLLAVGLAGTAHADDWIVRVGGVRVAPDTSSQAIPAVGPGSAVDVEDATSLGINLTYRLTDHWGIDSLPRQLRCDARPDRDRHQRGYDILTDGVQPPRSLDGVAGVRLWIRTGPARSWSCRGPWRTAGGDALAAGTAQGLEFLLQTGDPFRERLQAVQRAA